MAHGLTLQAFTTSSKSFRTSAHAGLFLPRFPLPSHQWGSLLMPGAPQCSASHSWRVHTCLSNTRGRVQRAQITLLRHKIFHRGNTFNLRQCELFVCNITKVDGFRYTCVGVEVCLCVLRRYRNRRGRTQGANVISACLLNWSNWERDRQHKNCKALCQTNCF